MSATPSIVIGKEGFGIKNGNLLGYYRADDGIYVARQFTATRGGGTNGTFVNSSGLIEVAASPNLPRIDFSSGSKAVLIEPAATNLALYSEEFDSVSWNSTGINRTGTPPFVDQEVAPNGTMTADKLIEDTSSGLHNLRSAFVTSTLVRHAFSFFAKKSEKDVVGIRTLGNGLFGEAIFNLNNGTVISVSGTGSPEAKIENFANGWYRCILTAIPDQTIFSLRASLYGVNDTLTYTGDGTSGVFIWGAQIETGAVATSYIPTTTGTITRNADVITLANASEYIGQTEGTVYMEVDLRNLSTGIFRRLINVTDGTLNNRLQINTTDTNSRLQLLLFQGGVTQVSIVSPSAFSGVVKLAAAYAVNDIAFYVNGVQIGTDTSASIPAFSQVNLGTNVDGASAFNDRIRAAAIYTTRLSDAQLIDMTWQ